MKRFLAGMCLGVAVVTGLRAQERFSQAVRREDFSAAGLAKLTPEELARLDALVGDYKSGALLAARSEAERAEQARVAAEAKANRAAAEAQAAKAAAEARVAKAEASTVAEPKKSEGGLLAKAKALLPAGTPVEYAAIESRIAGDFTGWEGKAVFTLENGQRWQMANAGNYYTPAVKRPAVKIAPAAMGGFWMTIEGVSQRVKVVPLETGK
jgi:hypothetical protein